MTDDRDGLDYSERNGFLVGKAARIADWQHEKEEKEFRKLVSRLRKANDRKRVGKAETARRQAIYMKRWRAKAKTKAKEAAYKRAWEKSEHGKARVALSRSKPESKAKARERDKRAKARAKARKAATKS